MGVTRIVLAIAMAGSCAFAQSPAAPAAEDETVLPSLTVSASDGAPVALEDVGVSVTVLNVEDLKEEGIFTLNAALQEVPGVFTLAGGNYGQGNMSNIAIRGMSSDAYTLPSIDGLRLNNVNTTIAANLVSQVNLFNVGTLEILRGTQSAIYGGGAIGGVLFMETPEGKGEPSYSIFNEYGSFDSYTGSLTAQGQQDKLSYFFNATYMRTGNDLEMADKTKYPYQNAGKSEMWQEALRLDYAQNEDNKTTLTYRRNDNEYRNVTAGVADYTMTSNLLTLKHSSKINELYSSSLMAGYYDGDNNWDGGQSDQTDTLQLEWKNNFKWNEQHATKAGFAWNRSDYKAITAAYESWGWLYPAGEEKSVENVYALYAEHNYKPADNWDNSLGLRYDISSIYDDQFTLRAATSYKFNKDNTRAFASVGTGYKAPSQFEASDKTYSYWGYDYTGNPDLKVETSVSFDFGLEQKIAEDHKLSATYFWVQTKDKIDAVWDYSTYSSKFENLAGYSLSQGVELSLSGVIEKNWNTQYSLSFTYTQPKYSDDSQISYTTRQLWSADIHTSPCEKLVLGLGLTAAAGRTTWQDQDSYYTMRLYANYKVNENLSFHLRVENLTDQKYVTDPNWMSSDMDMIGSGMGVYGGCTIKF